VICELNADKLSLLHDIAQMLSNAVRGVRPLRERANGAVWR
jgi:hypothetical protein